MTYHHKAANHPPAHVCSLMFGGLWLGSPRELVLAYAKFSIFLLCGKLGRGSAKLVASMLGKL